MDREQMIWELLERCIPDFAKLQYREDAMPSYDVLADAIIWTDEMPKSHNRDVVTSVRYLGNMRLKIARGFQRIPGGAWDRFIQRVPSWPGLRAERCDNRLIALYERLNTKLDLPDD